MVLMEVGGLTFCFILNVLLSHRGHNGCHDRQLFLPSTSIFFMFYPIVIALPQAHYKLVNYSLKGDNSSIDQDDLFPYAFLLSLFSITISAVLDKFILDQDNGEQEQGQEHKHLKENQPNWSKHKNTLQFLLTLSIALQNVVNYYFICLEDNPKQMIKEMLLFLLFTLILNFSHGYLLSQAGVSSKTNIKLAVFTSSGMTVGYILSLVLKPDMALLTLPCICAGLQIYCAIFVCFGYIFTNGQKPKEDRFRFLAVLIAFFITIFYYPVCYILRI